MLGVIFLIKNIKTIQSFGNKIIPVVNGELASGLFGEGRMAEPEQIIDYLIEHFFFKQKLNHKKVLITAGPTYEAIDPVRFIGNHSSGKMGYAIAEAFLNQGAEVTLVSGPTNLKISSNIKFISVVTGEDMYNEVMSIQAKSDIIVMCAAVADYKPKLVAENKIKKKDDLWHLELEKTIDILQELGKLKTPNQFLVGFALETNNEENNALEKLKKKNLDAIVLNKFNHQNKVFGSDLNEITIIDASITKYKFESKSKIALANDIVSFIISKMSHEEN